MKSLQRNSWAAFVGSAAILLVLVVPRPAAAVSQCGDQVHQASCGASNPFPCCSSGGNCTWWAWEAACRYWHVDVPMRHNAKTWADVARTNPNYKVLDYPVVNSIAVSNYGEWGHVAWVTAVHGNQIDVTEEKCGAGYGLQHSTYYASQFDGGFIVQSDYDEGGGGSGGSGGCSGASPTDRHNPWTASLFFGLLGLWLGLRRRW